MSGENLAANTPQATWRPTDARAVISRENISRTAPWAILAAFTAVCLGLSYILNIWQDEAYSLHTSGSGVMQAFQQGIGFEAQAPFYFVLLATWRLINASVFHARLLSVICAVIALYVTWQFARRYLRTVDPVLTLGVVALNPFTVWAAVEIRPYSAVLMCSAVLLFLFFRGFVDDKPSNVARVAYVLVAILGIYTQYYVAFMLPANGAALLLLRRPRAFWAYVVSMIPVGVALIPLAFILPRQFSAYHAFAVAFKIPSYAMVTAVLEYAFPHNWIVSWAHRPALNALYFGAMLFPVAIAGLNVRRLSDTSKVLAVANVVMFGLFTAAIVLAHVHVLIPRHTIVMLIPITLLALAVIGDSVPEKRRLVLSAYVATFAVFALLSFFHDYRSMAKLGDWKRVASFVSANAHSSDLVAVFNAEAELPFRHYFHGQNVVRAIPHSMSFDTFDEDAFALRTDQAVADSFGAETASYSRVWLVESTACSTQGDFFGCRRLEKYVRRHFIVVNTTRFSGSTVVELIARRLRPAHAKMPSVT